MLRGRAPYNKKKKGNKMLLIKEKYRVKGRDFRRVISQARKIFDENFKNKNELFAKKFSLSYILHDYRLEDKASNPLFMKSDSEIYCEFYSECELGMKMIHALEIAIIKCGMAFDFRRTGESIKIILRYR